jgi:hypothetical protein
MCCTHTSLVGELLVVRLTVCIKAVMPEREGVLLIIVLCSFFTSSRCCCKMYSSFLLQGDTAHA